MRNTLSRKICDVSKMADREQKFWIFKYISWLFIFVHLYPLHRSEITIITEGNHFVVAFPENLQKYCQFWMVLTPSQPADSSDTFISVNISVPALNTSFTQLLTLGTPTSITPIDKSSSDFSSSPSHNKVIYVDAAAGKLSVIGRVKCSMYINKQKNRKGFGEFLAVPVEYWGTRYVVMAPHQLSCGYSTTILNTDLDNSIKIDIYIRMLDISGYVDINGQHIKENGIWNIPPQPRIDIFANFTDITGSILESLSPIGVLVGPRNEASLESALCSFDQSLFIEQLIPVYAWGKSYYISVDDVSTYKYAIRAVASLAETVIYYNYRETVENKTRLFKKSATLSAPGSSFNFYIKDMLRFDIVAADRPIMVQVFITSTSGMGNDGALMQAVMTKSWPDTITLIRSPNINQTVHLFMDTSCSNVLTFLSDYGLTDGRYNSLDKDKQELELYIPSVGSIQSELQITVYVNTNVEGCNGISGFSMNKDISGNDILGACPDFWSVECQSGMYFNIDKKICTTIQTTSATSSSSYQSTSSVDTLETTYEATTSNFKNELRASSTSEVTDQSSGDTLENSSVENSLFIKIEPTKITAVPDYLVSAIFTYHENVDTLNPDTFPDVSSVVTANTNYASIPEDLLDVTNPGLHPLVKPMVNKTLRDSVATSKKSLILESGATETLGSLSSNIPETSVGLPSTVPDTSWTPTRSFSNWQLPRNTSTTRTTADMFFTSSHKPTATVNKENNSTTTQPADNISMWTTVHNLHITETILRRDSSLDTSEEVTIISQVPVKVTQMVTPSATTSLVTAFRSSNSDRQLTKECPCFCQSRNNKTKLLIKDAVNELKVRTSNISRIRRLHTCAPDWRPRAITVGIVAITVTACCTLMLIIVPLDASLHSQSKKTKAARKYY